MPIKHAGDAPHLNHCIGKGRDGEAVRLRTAVQITLSAGVGTVRDAGSAGRADGTAAPTGFASRELADRIGKTHELLQSRIDSAQDELYLRNFISFDLIED